MNSDEPVLVRRTACPVCAKGPGEEVYRAPYASPTMEDYLEWFYRPQGQPEVRVLESEEYVLRRCTGCTLVYQENVPSDAFAHELYERWIDPELAFVADREARNIDYHAGMARELATVLAHLGSRRPVRVLDFGMGWGDWSLMARAFGCDVTGAELSEARIHHARSHGITTADLEDLPAGHFDLIHTEQVFEHLTEPVPILLRLRDSLAPRGLLKIGVPDGSGILDLLRDPDWRAPKSSPRSLNPVAPLEHINCFKFESLNALARTAGLKLVKFRVSESYAGLLRVDPSWPTLIKGWLRPVLRFVKPHHGTNLFFRSAQ